LVPEEEPAEPPPPQPDKIPNTTTATVTTTAFNVDFMVSPLSVVAPVLDNKKPGT
jgi:hypothetical protein